MTETPYSDHWHLSKGVPVSIIFALLIQTIGIVIWATRLESRVSVLESDNTKQDIRIARLEDISGKISVMEERQINVLKRLDIQTKTMQDILEMVTANSKTLSPR